MLIILRLAVLLNRSRNVGVTPQLALAVSDKVLSLTFDADWLAENPLTLADLEREHELLSQVDYEIRLSE